MSLLFGFTSLIENRLLNLGRQILLKPHCISNQNFCSKKAEKDPTLPKNAVAEYYNAQHAKDFGVIYDKKPFKLRLVPNKPYYWCTCGESRQQPFCDGTHKSPYHKIKLRPVRFQVAEEGDYWLCNCKQTGDRPFCDGTHKRPDIQEKK